MTRWSSRRDEDSDNLIALNQAIFEYLERGGRLLVPSRQRAAAVRLAFTYAHRRDERPWRTPEVLSFDAWVVMAARELARTGEMPLPRVLEPHAEWVLWRTAAQLLIDEAGDSRSSGLGADALADLLLASAELAGEWGIDLSALSADPTREAQWLSRAASEVSRRAAERAALPAHALWSCLSQRGVPPSAESAVAIGEPPAMLARWAQGRWVSGHSGVVATKGPQARRVRASVAADPDEELLRTAHWCRRRLEADPWARLLVVVPNLSTRRVALERAFNEVLMPASSWGSGRATPAFFIEGGRAISDYAEPAEAFSLLRTLSSRGDDQSLATLLEARCWGRAGEAARARLAARLRRLTGGRWRAEEFPSRLRQLSGDAEADRAAIKLCADAIESAVEALHAMNPAQGGWSAAIKAALRALGFPWSGELDSEREQLRRHVDQWLSAIESSLVSIPASRPREAIELLWQLAKRERFAPSSGDVPVTVTPAIEAPVVRYDGIRVLGLQADRWPQPVKVDPFIPYALQRERAIVAASPALRLAAGRIAMDQWLHCADEVVWSFARGEGDAQWQPSPLIEPWLTSATPESPARVTSQFTLAARLRSAKPVKLDRVRETIGAPFRMAGPIPGGSYALSDQLDCAFRAYARHRLHAREDEAAEPGISALRRGRFLHQVLNHLWGELRDSSRLHDPIACRAALERAIELAASEPLFALPEPSWQRVVQRERQRAARVIDAMLVDEARREPFEVIAREQPVELEIGGATLALRLDRIDRLRDGSQAVIDYKTGKYRRLCWQGRDLDTVQLWLYAQAAEHLQVGGLSRVGALTNLHLVAAGDRWAGLRSPEASLGLAKPAKEWVSIRDEAESLLARLVQDFLAGEASVAPRPSACRHCDLTTVCRRMEWRADAAFYGVDDEGGAEIES